jgi:glycosyltransferase involved in cell wall biosynthesis
VRRGVELLLADSPDDFAKSVATLLSDAAARRRLGNAARELVETKYSWGAVAREFAAALEKVVTKSRQSADSAVASSTAR